MTRQLAEAFETALAACDTLAETVAVEHAARRVAYVCSACDPAFDGARFLRAAGVRA